ncbi:MAG: hypothetical protein F4219_04525 [Gammaproteobacteria bacterium]|nr:hypothetical protein [Gammaproteobacteria bacterium]
MNDTWRICLLLMFLVTIPLGADSYISLQLGLATTQSEIDVDVIHVGHPTYCDSVLYPDPAEAPTDGACASDQRQRAYAGLFKQEGGWLTSVAYGRVFGSWRVEGFFERNQFGSSKQLLPLATSGDSAILSKTNEWSQFQLPNNSYDDQGTLIFGLNVIKNFDLATSWGWFGYLGAGLGVAALDFNYGNEFLRKTVDEGYLDVPFPVDWPVDAKMNAAGSLSAIDASIKERTLTYSLIAGVDVYSGPDVTLGLRVTWRVIDDVERDKALWTTIRSHAPVIADGRTPFESDFVFKSWSYFTVGLVATYHLGASSR